MSVSCSSIFFPQTPLNLDRILKYFTEELLEVPKATFLNVSGSFWILNFMPGLHLNVPPVSHKPVYLTWCIHVLFQGHSQCQAEAQCTWCSVCGRKDKGNKRGTERLFLCISAFNILHCLLDMPVSDDRISALQQGSSHNHQSDLYFMVRLCCLTLTPSDICAT